MIPKMEILGRFSGLFPGVSREIFDRITMLYQGSSRNVWRRRNVRRRRNVERRRKKSVHHRARSGGTELNETNALRCVALFLPAHPVISFPRSHGMGEEEAGNEWTVRKMELFCACAPGRRRKKRRAPTSPSLQEAGKHKLT